MRWPSVKAKKILLTGAAGIVGTALRPLLARRHDHVVLTDIAGIDDAAGNESFKQGDITDLGFVKELAAQVDGIVHLAGMVGHYSFDEVLGPNIIGTHNVFTAAQAAGVTRVVNASSHHVVGFFKRGAPIDETTAPRPDSPYGLSKAYGEAAAAYFADKFGLQILSIRIGYVGDELSDERRLHTWISARDLEQLIEIGLTAPNLGHQIVYGVSDNPDPFFDNSNAARLGYKPQDRSVDFVTDPAVLEMAPDPDSIAGGVVGGGFASVDFTGDKSRILD